MVAGLGGLGCVVGWHWEGKVAFGSVGVGDEVCRLNGSEYESAVGSLCGWLTILPPQSVGKTRPDGGSSLRSTWNDTPSSSVLKLFSFHGFLHLGNPRKPAKTRKLGNSETYVLFPGNLSKWWATETSETSGVRNLRKLANYGYSYHWDRGQFLGFRVSKFLETWKPMKTSENLEIFLPNCWCGQCVK